MKRYVTDEETSKRLEAAGVTKFGKFVWITDLNGEKRVIEADTLTSLAFHHIVKGHDYDPHVAYMLEELLEMVEGVEVSFSQDLSEVTLFSEWKPSMGFKSNSPTSALAKAVIWQKERWKLK